MFALKSHRLGKTKNRSDLERMTEFNPDEEIDDTVKTRFQEIGPQMTLKMRWIRRGPLGETGDEREKREKQEAETGEAAKEYGEKLEEGSGDEEMDIDGVREGGDDDEEQEEEDQEAEELAKREIGLDQSDAVGQPNFPSPPIASTSTSTAPPPPPTTASLTPPSPLPACQVLPTVLKALCNSGFFFLPL